MALYDRLIGSDDAGQPVDGKIPVHLSFTPIAA